MKAECAITAYVFLAISSLAASDVLIATAVFELFVASQCLVVWLTAFSSSHFSSSDASSLSVNSYPATLSGHLLVDLWTLLAGYNIDISVRIVFNFAVLIILVESKSFQWFELRCQTIAFAKVCDCCHLTIDLYLYFRKMKMTLKRFQNPRTLLILMIWVSKSDQTLVLFRISLRLLHLL